MFINNCPTFGITINAFRKANAVMSEDVAGLIDDILSERAGCCPLEGAKAALEDGAAWAGTDATPELLEQLYNLICEYEETANGACQ
jgi:hypothetical protein